MTRSKSLILSIILMLAMLLPASAQQPSESQKAAAQIAGSVLVEGQAMSYLSLLSDRFGPRLTGSASYRGSTEWAIATFRAMGIQNVKLEPFQIANAWERGAATGRITSPVERTLHIQSLGWTPSTPPGGIKGEVKELDDISSEHIKQESDDIRGHIIMLDLSKVFAEGISAFGRVIAAHKELKDAGALAVIWPDFEANNVLNAFSPNWGTEIAPLPVAQIGMEDGKLIRRLAESGGPTKQKRHEVPVEIEFQYENRVTGPVEVNNVIAEIPGSEKPDEWIIIGAHLDSWDYGTGAQDNGSGVAMVMEAARAIAASGRKPRRSIRFALWGGEEQGLLGSTAYVHKHSSELGKCIAVLNTDNGAGEPKGWKVEGREDVAQALKPISETLLKGLGGSGISMELTFDTDHGPFMIEGIPALDLWVDMEPYSKIHHKTSDTLDKVNEHYLTTGAAILALTAFTVADSAEPLAPRIDHQAVGDLLKKANLEGFLKAVGVWSE